MAYKNLVNVSCASITEVFRHLKDWLTKRNGIADYSVSGLGWTLHDSSFAVDQDNPSAGDWIVLYSAGESGKQDLYLYIKFVALGSGIIQTRAGLYWNPSTNAWVQPYPSSDQSGAPTSGSAFNLYIYGDLDGFVIIIGNGASLYGRYFGLLEDTMHDATIAVTGGSVTAGSDKVVTVDAVPPSWSVGKAVFIRDQAAIEKTTISAIDSNNVTLASLVNGYAAGAKIARDYGVFLSSGNNFLNSGFGQINHSGSVGSNNNDMNGSYDTIPPGYAAPDPMNNCHLTAYQLLYDTSPNGYYGRHCNVLNVSSSGITSGTVYTDDATGSSWRALFVYSGSNKMMLFREV